MSTRIRVATSSPYDVLVGHEILGELTGLVQSAQRVAVIYPGALKNMGEKVAKDLRSSGFDVHCLDVPDGEQSKDLTTAAYLWEELGRAGFTRSDAIVAVGGGATTDLAGFVAGTWLRGVDVVHIPTTLLGMVDAAVGGKTAINTGAGKNLVGAFHEPIGVLCDLAALETLPKADYVSGLAEVVKVGFTHDPKILALIEEDPAAAASPKGPHTLELIQRAIAVKAGVVADDLTEQGGREYLNYGHTLGHAIEKVENYGWRHGEAVSIGLVFVAELARRAGSLDEATSQRHRSVLDALGLPTSYDGDWEQLQAAMRIDKKSRGNRLRFVVLDALARPRILEDPEPASLLAAWEEVRRPRSGTIGA